MRLREDELIRAISPVEIINPGGRVFSYFSFDSRDMKKDGLFFALKGQRDGHDFVKDAIKKGALAAVVERPMEFIPAFVVKDTLKALGDAASFSLTLNKTLRLGITGSAGKTTTKEFVFSFLSKEFRTERTPGNWNNLIGVPVFILNRDEHTEALVIEMGISIPGEMDKLVDIAKPRTVLFTRIYATHTQFLGSLEGVREEKGKILKHAERAAFNLDDNAQEPLWERFAGEKRFFSSSREADVKLLGWKRISNGKLSVEISYMGKEIKGVFPFWSPVFIENLLAALAAASFFLREKPDIEGLKPLEGRGQSWERDGIFFIDESYNSNPDSLVRALFSLSGLEGTRIAVLSDMLELKDPEKVHREMGKKIADLKIDYLLFCGELMKYAAEEALNKREKVFWVETPEEAGKKLREIISPGSVVFFKGSHGTGLWQEVQKWK